MTAILSPIEKTAPEERPTGLVGVSRTRVLIAAALLGLGTLFLLILIIPGTLDGLDARSMYEVVQSIVARGDVTTASSLTGVPGVYGHSYSK